MNKTKIHWIQYENSIKMNTFSSKKKEKVIGMSKMSKEKFCEQCVVTMSRNKTQRV